MVVIRLLVGIHGEAELDIIHAKPADLGFEKAAIKALKQVRWVPAKQRDKDIRVWVSIPVQFKSEAT